VVVAVSDVVVGFVTLLLVLVYCYIDVDCMIVMWVLVIAVLLCCCCGYHVVVAWCLWYCYRITVVDV